jgi:outer membrane biogenesis lipoprotein LolB
VRYASRRPPEDITLEDAEKGEGRIMKARTALFATALLFAGSAFAFHCPQDMKKIDDAMAKNPKLSEAQMADVKKYRAEGEALHKAGKHQESLDTLAKAEKILGIQ